MVSAEQSLLVEASKDKTSVNEVDIESNYFLKLANFLWQADGSSYHPVWPVINYLSFCIL